MSIMYLNLYLGSLLLGFESYPLDVIWTLYDGEFNCRQNVEYMAKIKHQDIRQTPVGKCRRRVPSVQ